MCRELYFFSPTLFLYTQRGNNEYQNKHMNEIANGNKEGKYYHTF